VTEALAALRPLWAVRGNTDHGDDAGRLPGRIEGRLGPFDLLLLHDLSSLSTAEARRFHLIVHGHTHRLAVERAGGLIRVNPGSAGAERAGFPPTMIRARFDGDDWRFEEIRLG